LSFEDIREIVTDRGINTTGCELGAADKGSRVVAKGTPEHVTEAAGPVGAGEGGGRKATRIAPRAVEGWKQEGRMVERLARGGGHAN
jgi:hypothetical protein